MATSRLEELLNKIEEPPLPEITDNYEIDLRNFRIYLGHLKEYKESIIKFGQISKFHAEKTRVYNSKLETAEALIKAVLKDIERLEENHHPRNYKKFGGSQNKFKRVSAQQILENPGILNGVEEGIIEDEHNSIFVLRLSEEAFPVSECPVCDEAGFSSKSELIDHLKEHLTYTNFSHSSKPFQNENLEISKKYKINQLRGAPPRSAWMALASEIQNLYQNERQDEGLLTFKYEISNYLEDIFKTIYPNSSLRMYGSNLNGFTTTNSDLDLSLSIDLKEAFKSPREKTFDLISANFEGPVKTNDLCELIILSKICDSLEEIKATDIELRASARVRIINFLTPTEPKLEVDLCLNNDLAVENSKMLKAYSLIDTRVPCLGIVIKCWAKARKIADPKNGTLSSYAYIILLIFFLQRVSHPILPYLQLYVTEEKKIGEYDCSFDNDIAKYQASAQANQMNEGELLFEFFKFFSLFDWRNNVVDIRKRENVSKSGTQNEPFISIQDPFETTRNLGDVCKPLGVKRIKNEFKRAAAEIIKGKRLQKLLEYEQIRQINN
ncbi:unnamed protein product [Blepharisma stoltei]|uniref:Uncharacterized protein n=1 Tax=Blepharisma stoltei TaxID=1481888 RepID=A0AAU9J4U0_9CILI|nr:unnamed protein product [Blepharisma stoltei]